MAAILSSRPVSLDVEAGEGREDPSLQVLHEAPHVAAAAFQVQHDIGDPLARPMVGELPAAAAAVDGKARRIEEVFVLGRGAGGIERRMLQQPHHLRCPARADIGDPPLHEVDRGRIIDRRRLDAPLHPARAGFGFAQV
jgi:hypothetical protein